MEAVAGLPELHELKVLKGGVKEIKVGILGLGVVGSGLVEQIRENIDKTVERYGVKIIIKAVYVKNLDKERAIDTNGLVLTSNAWDVIYDPEISVICECIGGNGFAETRYFVSEGLNHGKHVIMSSKKALSHFAREFLSLARRNHVILKYDATVGGGIPIAKVIENAFKGDTITEIKGIFNATSNFIFTQMTEQGLSYQEALKIAQDKGYAENDPTEDVGGYDALNKLVILTLFATHKYIHPENIEPVSCSAVTPFEIEEAVKEGFVIKPVASVKFSEKGYEIQVGPQRVSSKSILAITPSNYNTIIITGKNCGELAFYGQGAGAAPTASAMFDDLAGIFNNPV